MKDAVIYKKVNTELGYIKWPRRCTDLKKFDVDFKYKYHIYANKDLKSLLTKK